MIRVALYTHLFITSCAQVKPLTGGFEDTIPPNIIKSLPENFSTNLREPVFVFEFDDCLLYTSPSPRDGLLSRMPSSA